MADPIISVRGLGKQYRLGSAVRHDTLRDQLAHGTRSVGQWLSGGAPARPDGAEPEIFWALKDVSFDVAPGEVVGIIGRNGAGKSTLLKILSQITEPTEGEVRLRGRVASLLEVGTGFHPELTGRENIFLNGAILGMSRAEIRRKFDDIVAFAEVEKFLDTPVKRYSSGMYVRLAFAVAAHLEPEILIVDEVLAVGDAAFQSRCMGKMEDVARQSGRTVLFVSHNMTAVQILCRRAVHLHDGRVRGIGPVDEQIRQYLEAQKTHAVSSHAVARLGPHLTLDRFEFMPNPVVSGGPLDFELELRATQPVRLSDLVILVYSLQGVRLAIMDLRDKGGASYELAGDRPLALRGTIDSLPLIEGAYKLGLYLACEEFYRDYYNLAEVTVLNRSRAGSVVPRKAVHRGLLELEYHFETASPAGR
jgi:lipopolysaccharide transport system ATP-binding protein